MLPAIDGGAAGSMGERFYKLSLSLWGMTVYDIDHIDRGK